MTVDSEGIVPDSVLVLKSARSRGFLQRALQAWASCSAMKARERS